MARMIDFWGRRTHIYVGLYFTLAVWFFALSGLALNRPEWFLGESGPPREVSTRTEMIQAPSGSEDIDIATDLISQLNLVGELDRWNHEPEKRQFWLRVTRPGYITDVNADLDSLKATVKIVDWGPLVTTHMLHTFAGVGAWRDRGQGATPVRDWAATVFWTVSMDAVCIGLLYMVVSGLYLWYRQPDKRVPGAIAIGIGVAGCMFFLFGSG
jgi:hypothetical protein